MMLRLLAVKLKKSMRITFDVKVVGNEALFMNVNKVVHQAEGVNVVPANIVMEITNICLHI
jgi:hypothetical protein